MTEFFYNIETKRVERGRQSPGEQLMGPYATEDEAQQALKTAADRNAAWDAEDEAWDNGS